MSVQKKKKKKKKREKRKVFEEYLKDLTERPVSTPLRLIFKLKRAIKKLVTHAASAVSLLESGG